MKRFPIKYNKGGSIETDTTIFQVFNCPIPLPETNMEKYKEYEKQKHSLNKAIYKYINELITNRKYRFIYVSLGSAINLGNPSGFSSNAINQMIPYFLYPSDYTILNIIIDNFQQLDHNIKMIKDTYTDVNKSKIDTIIVNWDLFDTNLIPIKESLNIKLSIDINIIKIIHDILTKNKKICPPMVAIVNYVKFYSPNGYENILVTKLDEIIYSVLGKYQSSYYVWFGYDKLFYNSIYKYENYKMISVIKYRYQDIFRKFFNKEPLNSTETTQIRKIFKFIYPINEITNFITNYSEIYFS